MLGIAALVSGTIMIGFVVGYCTGMGSQDKQIAKIKKENEQIEKLFEEIKNGEIG